MTEQDIYRDLIRARAYDRTDLPEVIGLIEEQIAARRDKVARLQGEIAMLAQRGDSTETQRASLAVTEEEISALEQRRSELQQEFDAPVPAAPVADPDLVIGGVALVAQNGGPSLELRTRPGLTDSGIIDRHPSGELLTLLDGPDYVDGHLWWRVRRIDGREGWVASDGLQGRPG